jgi:hypothetical protein
MDRVTTWAATFAFLLVNVGCSSRDVGTPFPDGAGGGGGSSAGGAAGGGAGGPGDAAVGDDAFTIPPTPDAASPVDGGCQPQGEQTFTPAADGVAASNEEFAQQTFNSNPPSSGKHCAQAGGYGNYDEKQPLPRCNYLANLALGGVVLTYNCPEGCADILGHLPLVFRDVGKDPDCPSLRILITPDKDLDVKVAATAWGATWRSNCMDQTARASLVRFVKAHLGSAGSAPGKAPAVCM